ncbi:hypothetical protein GCM10010345_37560 [Streptomyces canarius]|uniref:NADPH-dependent FMN reductase-like domain-containing protein n=1 Tax=Streptomyces canarius TaxID=285453 RepID=A0ABQ3CPL2_9ACTN|nr:hypothetical protein GCM10010345_37560 [Streptomyces canarius]
MINWTLKRSPDPSHTEAPARVVTEQLAGRGVAVEVLRAVDLPIGPGVVSEAVREGGAWPAVHHKLLDAEILVVASSAWFGHPSSVAQRVSETDDEGRPVASNRVAGVVVTGNEDGAHHVIGELQGALADIGSTVPGRAWTYWHLGPGPGPDCLEEERGRDWSHRTGRAMAANLYGVARAPAERPVGAPPG